MVVPYLIFGVIAYFIARYLGTQRQIDFNWSFFFSIFLTPIGGLIVIMLSKKKYEEAPKPSKGKIIIGWLLIIMVISSIFTNFYRISNGKQIEGADLFSMIITYIGIFGLGQYLIKLGKGLNNASTELITRD